MRLLFVGSIYPDYLLNYLLSIGEGADFAANNFQQALLEGFVAHCGRIEIVSSPSIANPHVCDAHMLCARESSVAELGNSSLYYVGSTKKKWLKLPSELFRVRSTVKHLLCDDVSKNIVCCYALHSPFLLALVSLRRRFKKGCVIVPDLPEFMSDQESLFRRIVKRIDRKVIDYCVRRLDCFAFLSDAMADQLPIKDQPWVLVEGIYRSKTVPDIKKNDKIVILYTGQLKKRYGVFDLVEAFKRIPNSDYELWLCGGGSQEEMKWLQSQSDCDGRIKLLGRVSPDKALALQKEARLLVNPRHSDEEFTKYSFPSKTMEYLASGTPTLMCRLSSIPEEYYEHLFFFDDESVEGMANKIIEVCQISENALARKGLAASEFIRTRKNAFQQVGKILSLLQE